MGFRTSLATLSLMEIANVRGLEGKMGRELLVLVVGGRNCGSLWRAKWSFGGG